MDEIVGLIVEQLARRVRAAAAPQQSAAGTNAGSRGAPPTTPRRPPAPGRSAPPAAPAAAPFDGGLSALPSLDAADPFGGVGSAIPVAEPDARGANAGTLLAAFSVTAPLLAAFVFAEALAPPVALRDVHNLSDSRGV